MQGGQYAQHMATVALVPAFELSETALKLSRVIEREANRRSALRSGSLFRVEQNFPVFRRMSSRMRSSVGRSNRSKRSVTSVAPTPEENETTAEPAAPPARFLSGSLSTIRSASPTVSPHASVKAAASMPRRPESQGSDQADDGPYTWKERLWEFFDDPQSSAAAYYFSISLFFFIALSTAVFIAQTEKSLAPYANVLNAMETTCAAVFTVEYTLRAVVSPSKWRFIKAAGNWVDLAAILPFYLEVILNVENAGSFGAIRIVRLTRVARVLKMSRYSSAIQVFVQAIAISIKALSMLVFLMAIAVIVFSSAVYFAEYTPDGCRRGGWVGDCDGRAPAVELLFVSSVGEAAAVGAALRPEANATPPLCVCVDPNPYYSIAASFWWSIVTMSTVGYGDMTPVTIPGRIVGIATILTGMLVLALPITVIGTNFQKVMKSVMHQTMKSNVDYLKGKKQICRQEIQAILQRFHAVTTDIHLDIDDIIQVYDTDNSGTLEDDELARFCHDLEMLQNRAFMNQHMDLQAPTATAVTVAAPLAAAATVSGARTFGSMMRKLSARSMSTFVPMAAAATGTSTKLSMAPTPSPSRSPAVSSIKAEATGGAAPATSPSSPLASASHRRIVRGSKSQPNNLTADAAPPASVTPVVQIPTMQQSTPVEKRAPIVTTATQQPLCAVVSPVRDAGPRLDEFEEEEEDDNDKVDEEILEEALLPLSRPSSPRAVDARPASPEPPSLRGRSTSTSGHNSSSQSHRQPHTSHSSSHHYSHHHTGHEPRGHHGAPGGPHLSDDDVMLTRLVEMQRSFEGRLLETEARLDAKILTLSKIMLRVEALIEMND